MSKDLTIGDHHVRRDGDMWCITDLWRAHGALANRKPKEWLRSADAQRLIEFLSDSLEGGNSHLTKARKNAGGGGDTWAHWQLALAYAKWLSPAFHARVNEVYRAFTAGQLVAVERPPSLPSAEPVQARIGDDPPSRRRVAQMCKDAAARTERTIQSIQGEIRKPWGVSSIYRIPFVSLGLVETRLREFGSAVRRLSAAGQQLLLWGSK